LKHSVKTRRRKFFRDLLDFMYKMWNFSLLHITASWFSPKVCVEAQR